MTFLFFILSLLLAPLLYGIINKTKAFFAGREGRPLLQLYFDIIKLLKKGAVYSSTTTFIFKLAPLIALCAPIIVLFFLPFGNLPPIFSFQGDFILVLYVLALSRFFTVIASLDTGSSFEGMGASREMQFAVFSESAMVLSLLSLVGLTHKFSLASIYEVISHGLDEYILVLAFVVAALFIVFLIENCRIPVDDPNTHLELTMIHEVMILDHGGVDLAFLLYGASLKFWVLGMIIVELLIPKSLSLLGGLGFFLGGMVILALLIGIIESILARVRLIKVPYLALTAAFFALLSIIFQLR